MAEPVIQFDRVCKSFDGHPVLRDFTLSVERGEFLTVIGRSGCGKTTALRLVNGLIAADSGRVLVHGQDVARADPAVLRRGIGYTIQNVGLFPHMTVEKNIAYVPSLSKSSMWKGAERRERAAELLRTVGLEPGLADRYPRELSGGQRQRVGIARALALNPKFVVCDEPVSALDVSIQAQILNLIQDLQKEHGLTFMFITHDLSVVRHISHNICVMYLGQLVETAPSKQLFISPLHPYTKALLSAIPSTDIHNPQKRILLQGEVVSPINPKPGCRFAARCPYACEECKAPQKLEELLPGHFVSCCRAREINKL